MTTERERIVEALENAAGLVDGDGWKMVPMHADILRDAAALLRRAEPQGEPERDKLCACGQRGPHPHWPLLPGDVPTPNCQEGYAMCDGAWCMVHGCGRYEEAKTVPPEAQVRPVPPVEPEGGER